MQRVGDAGLVVSLDRVRSCPEARRLTDHRAADVRIEPPLVGPGGRRSGSSRRSTGALLRFESSIQSEGSRIFVQRAAVVDGHECR